MLKMKVDPTICMKTKRERQNVMPKMRLFTRKCTHYTVIDNSRADLLADYAQIARQFGAKRVATARGVCRGLLACPQRC
jgi:hypothetical protein